MSPELRLSRHVAGMVDLQDALEGVLQHAIRLKAAAAAGAIERPLAGKAVLLIFERNSTRTRVSFELGVRRLGGDVAVLDAGQSQMARGESLEDTAKVLSRYADAIVYRAASHAHLVGLAEHADVPVINALTETEHPCQVLADLMTLLERWGRLRGRTLAYVGDGNNMCHSYLLGAALSGMHVRVATPAAYAPDAAIVEQAEVLARLHGGSVQVGTDPCRAVRGADAVATDTWISMGDEEEADDRRAAFAGFCVDRALLGRARRDALFLHCLPGHWGEEATHDVAHGPQSVIYDQAENRMWAQMALLVHLLARSVDAKYPAASGRL